MSGTNGTSRASSGTKKKNAPRSTRSQPKPVRREVGGVVCAFLGVFTFIGFFDVDALFIEGFCAAMKGLLGWGYYFVPPVLLLAAAILLFHRGRPVLLRVVCAFLIPVVLGAVAHLLLCRAELSFDTQFSELCGILYKSGVQMGSGGVISGLTAMGLDAMFSVYGALPVLIVAFVFLLMLALNLSLQRIGQWWSEREPGEYERRPSPPARSRENKTQGPEQAPAVQTEPQPAARPRRAIDIPVDEDILVEDYQEERVGFFNKRPRVKTPDQVLTGAAPVPAAPPAAPETPAAPLRGESPDVKAVRGEVEAQRDAIAQTIEKNRDSLPEYKFPPVELLRRSQAAAGSAAGEIAQNRSRLESTIQSFGVSAHVTDVTRGPSVTRYDLELDQGVKLNKLMNLSGDLALALGVTGVRIAPIPDKISTVGIEVPNKIVSIVCLRDIIESKNFTTAASSLSFSIGKDISGSCMVGNIAKLPHLLIAGTTGSGKSVCINSILLSLLYKSTPEQVRLIMIDPKMVELGVYNGIPHLFVPVVTDPKKAAGALQWAVVEMLKRYRLFSEVGVRDLAGYNAYQAKVGGETMPQIVVVVDELADLMLCAAKDVEESICRVAQMGRASGMHLIIATQRPSADVITGLMKANIPSRIAFAVSSALESRIILDQQGAEKLVGMGDMLYSPLGSGKPIRIQGAYVSDEEREDVIDFIKENAEANYSDEVIDQIEKAASDKDAKDEPADGGAPAIAGRSDYDELLPQAVDVLFETKQASVSMLQRRLKLGYSRAARLVDQMEEMGIVGPFEGSKPRALLITREQWQEMQLVQGTAPTERFSAEMEFGVDGDS